MTISPAVATISMPSMRNRPALEHLESFLHVRVDVLGDPVTGPRPGREHGQGFGCLRHELDAFS